MHFARRGLLGFLCHRVSDTVVEGTNVVRVLVHGYGRDLECSMRKNEIQMVQFQGPKAAY